VKVSALRKKSVRWTRRKPSLHPKKSGGIAGRDGSTTRPERQRQICGCRECSALKSSSLTFRPFASCALFVRGKRSSPPRSTLTGPRSTLGQQPCAPRIRLAVCLAVLKDERYSGSLHLLTVHEDPVHSFRLKIRTAISSSFIDHSSSEPALPVLNRTECIVIPRPL